MLVSVTTVGWLRNTRSDRVFSVECDGSYEAENCCTETNKCQLGGGNCGYRSGGGTPGDAACAGDLLCGTDNCGLFHDNADLYYDCCTGKDVSNFY